MVYEYMRRDVTLTAYLRQITRILHTKRRQKNKVYLQYVAKFIFNLNYNFRNII